VIVASLHTDGAFEYVTPAECPSVVDVEADESEWINGYVSTSGGRLWFVDGLIVKVLYFLGDVDEVQ
jgi:hypothetical protein